MAVGGVIVLVTSGGSPLVLAPIPRQEIDELSNLQFTVAVEDAGRPGEPLKYGLSHAPPGAHIEADSGRFSWYPSEEQGPGEYEMTVSVTVAGSKRAGDSKQLRITVREINRPPALAPIDDKSVDQQDTLTFTAKAEDPDVPGSKLRFRLLPSAPLGASIDAESGRFEWTPAGAVPGVYPITICALEAAPGGLRAMRTFNVRVEGSPELAEGPGDELGRPPVDPPDDRPPALARRETEQLPEPSDREGPEDPAAAQQPAGPQPNDEEDAILLDLCNKRRLLNRAEYPTVRGVFARRFEREHLDEIKAGCGDDYEKMAEWFETHTDIKEELYTAIDPESDKIPAAIGLFNELRKQFPDKLASYANLAIAVAVTWDDPGKGVYDYRSHQRRTKSTMPEGMLEALENFQYILDQERSMQGRGQFLPWEFLVHLVNHKTPLVERQWALGGYLSRRVMYGRCYHDVPYDKVMLDTQSKTAALNDKAYTLENIRRFGGVCAMQADFAARVGKSIGVPAEYVRGESTFGDFHAWVMWVELQSVTKSGIGFRLESYGRYRLDKYYVGTLTDPQSGRKITDRQLELRLHTVGLSPLAKRHADLVMKAYPMLREETEMDVNEQLGFLDRLIRLSPGNEAAWGAVAEISREGQVTKRHTKMMMKILERLFATFAGFPDFTWKIFDDLVAFQDLPKKRALLYGRLVQLYEQAGRPDLSCEARLKYTDYLVEQDRFKEAIEGLAYTIKKFPAEGRYVPRMLDKLEAICGQVEGSQGKLLQFYQQYLPMIPQKRGQRPSKFCVKMFQRGIARFREAGQNQVAQMYQMQLERITAGQGMKR